ncbi:LPS export ABC transporter permease LptG [Marinimicrobium sp. LS-A18]|uniref:LPS export ABC transporter permease LptG n=1 Tax=Marinimicrobium sp. LS-A18 TaxID=1381596 RepID=UPI000463F78B|nr:LPS export ABC transporter permease LptG [Marinimicrobium sp. LS-A18]
MRKISRYIARTVFAAIALVLLVVLSLDLIGGFIDEVADLRADYDVSEALIYIALTMPGRIYEYIPYASLIGCLAGLGLLASSSELVVMRAAGVSVVRITWLVLKPVFVFIAIGLMLGEYVTPYTDQVAESRRAVALGGQRALNTERGLWHREGNEFLYFNAVQPNGILHGVTRYRFDDERQLEQASYAEQATFQQGYWQEEGVSVTHFEEEGTRVDAYALRRWKTDLTPDLLNIIALPPEGLSIRNLVYYVDYLAEQQLENSEYRLAFWEKALQPLATISLVLVAISFIFGPLREVTMGQRIFTGVVFGIAFQLTQSLLGPSSLVFGFPPLLAVLIPIAACAAFGLFLLSRTR